MRCAMSARGSTRPKRMNGATSGGMRVADGSVRRPSGTSLSIRPLVGSSHQGDPFEPIKIGLLVDIELGQLLADWVDASILAIEDALNEGVYDRPVQLVLADARGLPRESYLKVRQGYEWLCDRGCVVVLGPMISDNSLNIQELVNARKVACLAWTGAWRYTFRIQLHRRQR